MEMEIQMEFRGMFWLVFHFRVMSFEMYYPDNDLWKDRNDMFYTSANCTALL